MTCPADILTRFSARTMLHAEYPRGRPAVDQPLDLSKLREPKNAALRASASEQLAGLMTDDALLADRRAFMARLATINARVLPQMAVRMAATAPKGADLAWREY